MRETTPALPPSSTRLSRGDWQASPNTHKRNLGFGPEDLSSLNLAHAELRLGSEGISGMSYRAGCHIGHAEAKTGPFSFS